MSIKTGGEAIILLLHPGPEDVKIERINRTQIEKILFLLKREAGFEIGDYKFKADDYGPCAEEMYDDLEVLLDTHILEPHVDTPDLIFLLDDEIHEQDSDEFEKTQNATETYSLTNTGKKVAQRLYNELKEDEKIRLNRIKREFGSLPLNDLIRYVYNKYPDLTIGSKIKYKILLKTAFGSKSKLTKFKRDEDDFRS